MRHRRKFIITIYFLTLVVGALYVHTSITHRAARPPCHKHDYSSSMQPHSWKIHVWAHQFRMSVLAGGWMFKYHIAQEVLYLLILITDRQLKTVFNPLKTSEEKIYSSDWQKFRSHTILHSMLQQWHTEKFCLHCI